MLGRIQETDSSAPFPMGAFEYYTRTEAGKQYPIFCRRSPDEVILDCNALAAGHDYFSLAFSQVSPDGNILAYATDTDGSEVYTLRFKDLRTGQPGRCRMRCRTSIDSRRLGRRQPDLPHTTLDQIKRRHRLWRYAWPAGTGAVFEEPDERLNVSISRSRSGESRFWPGQPLDYRVPLVPGNRAGRRFHADGAAPAWREYYVEHQGDSFWARTNENARNFKLMRLRGSEREGDPHREDVTLEDIASFRDHLVLIERTGASGASRFAEPIITTSNSKNRTTRSGSSGTKLRNPEPALRLHVDGYAELRRRIRHEHAPAPLAEAVRRRSAGTSLRRRLRTDLRWQSPDLARLPQRSPAQGYAALCYGAYGITTDPAFSSERISLLDRGLVFAIAHIRGSGDRDARV